MEKLLRTLERRFARFAPPNVAAFLIAPKAAFLLWAVAESSKPGDGAALRVIAKLLLIPQLVLEGEVWRVVTFTFIPPTVHPLWFLIYAYILFLFCSGLQARWGSFRLWVYVLTGWFLVVASGFISLLLDPDYILGTGFLTVEATLLLAFATYYPNVEFRLFFVLPVKVKWLALLTAAWGAVEFARGEWDATGAYANRIVVLAAFGNYLLFFGPALWTRYRELRGAARRRHAFESAMRRGWEERDRLAEEDRERERDGEREHEGGER